MAVVGMSVRQCSKDTVNSANCGAALCDNKSMLS